MKEKRYWVLLFLTCFSITAQIKGFIVDDKNQPIPYVNIWVENENIGTTSNEDGIFTINASNDKILVFSAVGFETKKSKISNNDRVVLKIAIYNLSEIVITKSSRTKEIEIGNHKKSFGSHLSGSVPWIYAKRFEFDTVYRKTPFLKNAVVLTKSKIKNATFKLRIFSVMENGFPGDDLLNENVVIVVKKGINKNIIDLSKYHLTFPVNGIFVAYEWMIIEQNKYFYDPYSKESSKEKFITYAPAVMVNKVETENTFTYREGKWFSRKGFSLNEKSNKVVIEPAINLTLTN